jgi:UMF1 family MFS transporter
VADVTDRGRVFAWGLWDWGSSAYNAVILTFVFSVYLTDAVGRGLPGPIDAGAWLGYAIGAAGLLIALAAPVLGQRSDAAGRRKFATGVWTACTVATMAALFAVREDWHWLWLGLVLLAMGSIFYELASVSYNAMLVQVSTPATMGRVSGFGWSMGYFGGIVQLLGVYLLLIAGDGGALGVSTADGLNIRVVALVAAAWFAVFAIPLLVVVPELPAVDPGAGRLGVAGSYRKLVHDLRDLYRASPHTVYFLGASALFRDGLAAVFTFGAVLAVTVYGIDKGDVLIFGVVANVVSAAGALSGGALEGPDRAQGGDHDLARRALGGGRGPALRVRPDHVLDLRPVPDAVRRARAVLVADLPRAVGAARPRGSAVRPVRHHGARGVVPGPHAVRGGDHGVRRAARRHRRNPGGARGGPRGAGPGAGTG